MTKQIHRYFCWSCGTYLFSSTEELHTGYVHQCKCCGSVSQKYHEDDTVPWYDRGGYPPIEESVKEEKEDSPFFYEPEMLMGLISDLIKRVRYLEEGE